jgi:hypothetical protein
MPDPRGNRVVPATGYTDVTIMAVVCFFAGSVEEYQVQFATWVLVVRPEHCPHCGAEHTYIFWGTYARWVYTTTERVQIRIQRVRCLACMVTDALLPSFLHMFRRYLLPLIQQAISLALDRGLWGDHLADAVGPCDRPAFSTVHEWLWSFVLSAVWLLPWLQQALLALDPLTPLDVGLPPEHLLNIRNARRRTAFLQGWQVLRLAQALYAASRARQPDLAFQATMLLAFLAAALGASGRMPRLLWLDGVVATGAALSRSGRRPDQAANCARPP